MKTIQSILSVAVLAIIVSACGNGAKTPDLNTAQSGLWSNNTNNTNNGNSASGGSCTGAVNIRNVQNNTNYEYSACRTAQNSIRIAPSTTNFNDSVCIFYATNGNPLYNSYSGSFVYQCVNLTSSGQTLNAQGVNANSIYVARSAQSQALVNCFYTSAQNPYISIQECANSYGISYSIGGI